MKRPLLLMIFIAVAVAFASCKKRDYVCTCVENHGGKYVTTDYPLGNINDNTAQNMCDGRQQLLSKNGTPAQCKTNFE
jgi:hypothetical protein